MWRLTMHCLAKAITCQQATCMNLADSLWIEKIYILWLIYMRFKCLFQNFMYHQLRFLCIGSWSWQLNIQFSSYEITQYTVEVLVIEATSRLTWKTSFVKSPHVLWHFDQIEPPLWRSHNCHNCKCSRWSLCWNASLKIP